MESKVIDNGTFVYLVNDFDKVEILRISNQINENLIIIPDSIEGREVSKILNSFSNAKVIDETFLLEGIYKSEQLLQRVQIISIGMEIYLNWEIPNKFSVTNEGSFYILDDYIIYYYDSNRIQLNKIQIPKGFRYPKFSTFFDILYVDSDESIFIVGQNHDPSYDNGIIMKFNKKGEVLGHLSIQYHDSLIGSRILSFSAIDLINNQLRVKSNRGEYIFSLNLSILKTPS
jgi:hypothetical protein